MDAYTLRGIVVAEGYPALTSWFHMVEHDGDMHVTMTCPL